MCTPFSSPFPSLLSPPFIQVWSPRLLESLWFGCVPVIIADHYVLPLDTFIDWTKAAVLVPERDTVKLLGILRSVSDFQWTRMQFYGRKVGSGTSSLISASTPDYLKYLLGWCSIAALIPLPPFPLQVSHHLTWHNPPRPFDAFYSILFQLWRKSMHRTTSTDTSHDIASSD